MSNFTIHYVEHPDGEVTAVLRSFFGYPIIEANDIVGSGNTEKEAMNSLFEKLKRLNIDEINEYISMFDNFDIFPKDNISNKSGKRKDYISKEELFMEMAKLVAKRSKDPNTQVGCVIVSKDDRILSLGYNGMPNGCSDDEFPWVREVDNISDPDEEMLNTKYLYVVHSELNAILNFKGSRTLLEGSTLYVTLFPCNECCKAIIQSGIKKVIYGENKYKDTPSVKASLRMFKAAGVKVEEYGSKE